MDAQALDRKETFGKLLDAPFVSKLTLLFREPLETRFLDYYCESSLWVTRQAIIIGFLFYSGYAALDAQFFPNDTQFTWTLRFAVMCPALVVMFWLTFTRYWRRIFTWMTAFNLFLSGFGIIVMIAHSHRSENIFQIGGITLVMFFGLTFLRSRYSYMSGVCFLLTFLMVGLAAYLKTDANVIVQNFTALICICVIGTYSSYSFEYFVRKNFVQDLIVKERNLKLESTNSELSQANRQLARSREELLESGKRADLIFSALSEALPGTVIDDKYLIEARLGSGAFGTVYRAKHLLLDTTVALKIFKPIAGQDQALTFERFRTEGASAQRVNHTNAVRVYDFGISMNSIAYLVMEFLDGRSLEEILKDEHRQMPMDLTVHILRSLAAALAHAHQAGVVHRDIKPGNVFVSETGDPPVVKLVDFGIAKIMDDAGSFNAKNATATGIVIGTPSYMAPERFLAQAYDGRSDVYSLGCLAYELVTGSVPFKGVNHDYMSVAMLHIQEQPQPITKIKPRADGALSDLVERMLAKDPSERPSADDIVLTLDSLYAAARKAPRLA